MTAPIALQLYSVREDLEKDFEGTLHKIAEMGYLGVETAGFPGTTPENAKKLFDELELTVTSAHSPLPLGEDKNQILETLATVGCPHLVSAWMDPKHYQSRTTMRKLADTFNQAYEICQENGLDFSIHNHDFEFQIVEGIPAIQILKEYLNPGIYFELDTYWIHVAGQDPVKMVPEFGPSAPLIHIKDGPAVREKPMTAVGDGVVDVPRIIKAGSEHTEWLIVEIDRCATDMLAAVEKSYRYLFENNLAHGKN
jgi:sugar phosphate isomerase/epimerase